jgi:hypothetical protein
MTCLLSLMYALSLMTSYETSVRTGLDHASAFIETPIRPFSIAFEQDTRAYVKLDRYELSLDMWRMPSATTPRPAMGIDLWSLMMGIDF